MEKSRMCAPLHPFCCASSCAVRAYSAPLPAALLRQEISRFTRCGAVAAAPVPSVCRSVAPANTLSLLALRARVPPRDCFVVQRMHSGAGVISRTWDGTGRDGTGGGHKTQRKKKRTNAQKPQNKGTGRRERMEAVRHSDRDPNKCRRSPSAVRRAHRNSCVLVPCACFVVVSI
jgi:hypothetical protein